MIQYAGVSVTIPTETGFYDWLDEWLTDNPVVTSPINAVAPVTQYGIRSPIPQFRWHEEPRLGFNTLYWPVTGATRYARCNLLCTERQKTDIMDATSHGTEFSRLIVSAHDIRDDHPILDALSKPLGWHGDPDTTGQADSGLALAVRMYALPPRPIVRAKGAFEDERPWLIPLVDRRYYWQFKSRKYIQEGAVPSWSSYFDQIFDPLPAIAFPVDRNGPWSARDPLSECAPQAPLAAFPVGSEPCSAWVDALGITCGRRLVAAFDDTFTMQYADKATEWYDETIEEASTVAAGGRLTDAVVPESVRIQLGTEVRDIFPEDIDVETGSGSPQTIPNTQKLLKRSDPPPAACDTDTYAKVVAANYYGWARRQYHWVFQGLREWKANGHDDAVIIHLPGRDPRLRTEVSSLPTDVTPDTLVGVPATVAGPRGCGCQPRPDLAGDECPAFVGGSLPEFVVHGWPEDQGVMRLKRDDTGCGWESNPSLVANLTVSWKLMVRSPPSGVDATLIAEDNDGEMEIVYHCPRFDPLSRNTFRLNRSMSITPGLSPESLRCELCVRPPFAGSTLYRSDVAPYWWRAVKEDCVEGARPPLDWPAVNTHERTWMSGIAGGRVEGNSLESRECDCGDCGRAWLTVGRKDGEKVWFSGLEENVAAVTFPLGTVVTPCDDNSVMAEPPDPTALPLGSVIQVPCECVECGKQRYAWSTSGAAWFGVGVNGSGPDAMGCDGRRGVTPAKPLPPSTQSPETVRELPCDCAECGVATYLWGRSPSGFYDYWLVASACRRDSQAVIPPPPPPPLTGVADQLSRGNYQVVRVPCDCDGCGHVWYAADSAGAWHLWDGVAQSLVVNGVTRTLMATLGVSDHGGIGRERVGYMQGCSSTGATPPPPQAPRSNGERPLVSIPCECNQACGVARFDWDGLTWAMSGNYCTNGGTVPSPPSPGVAISTTLGASRQRVQTIHKPCDCT